LLAVILIAMSEAKVGIIVAKILVVFEVGGSEFATKFVELLEIGAIDKAV
jgi:hypothetical protein